MVVSGTQRIALAAGGTGGHVYPALAVIRALLARKPNLHIYFFGRRDGLERNLMEPLPLMYIGLTLKGIPRRVSLRWIISPILAFIAFFRTMWTFLWRRPQLVIGFGSYVAGPVILAALCLRIPTLVHEQNRVPGLTNRIIAPWVSRILVSDFQSGLLMKRSDSVEVGIPLRPEIMNPNKTEPCISRLEPKRNTLLVFGGSQGARRLCEVTCEAMLMLNQDLSRWQILFLTGHKNYELVKSKQLPSNIMVKDYIEEMGGAYRLADLVISRAGAVSLAEITAHGLPSILVPLSIATGEHQLRNAQRLESKGASRVIEERRLTSVILADEIRKLVNDPQRLAAMSKSSSSLARHDATELFLAEIEEQLSC